VNAEHVPSMSTSAAFDEGGGLLVDPLDEPVEPLEPDVVPPLLFWGSPEVPPDDDPPDEEDGDPSPGEFSMVQATTEANEPMTRARRRRRMVKNPPL
jgi:hypothetical protein